MQFFNTVFLFLSLLNGQEFFNPYYVHSMEISFYNLNYDHILRKRWEEDDKTYKLVLEISDRETLDDIDVKYKGN